MKNLNEYVQNETNHHLIEFINSQLQLTGLNRFYLKDDIVMSYYCLDWKKLISDMSSKTQRKVVIKYRGKSSEPISPLEMLKAIISFFNKRKADIQYPQNQIVREN